MYTLPIKRVQHTGIKLRGDDSRFLHVKEFFIQVYSSDIEAPVDSITAMICEQVIVK